MVSMNNLQRRTDRYWKDAGALDFAAGVRASSMFQFMRPRLRSIH